MIEINRPEEALKLENQLCFAIYACSREITKLYQPYLEQLGVTYSQYLVLMVLWEKGTSTVKELGDALHLDSGTLTPLLKRLQSSGLIHRERSQQDERKVMISLTEEGDQLRLKAASIPGAIRGKVCFSTQHFQSLLEEFNDLLKRVHTCNLEPKEQS
nr:MarR family transcriptional regulator [Paenibacillus massiliensis]